jgi:hypothetical protein
MVLFGSRHVFRSPSFSIVPSIFFSKGTHVVRSKCVNQQVVNLRALVETTLGGITAGRSDQFANLA